MHLAATRIITDDVDSLVAFYEQVTDSTVVRLHPMFAELRTAAGSLAIASSATVPMLGEGVAEAGANRTLILDFLVEDVDATHRRLREEVGLAEAVVKDPTDMPWGNRSLLVRDPDGNLINFFTPIAEGAPAPVG